MGLRFGDIGKDFGITETDTGNMMEAEDDVFALLAAITGRRVDSPRVVFARMMEVGA